MTIDRWSWLGPGGGEMAERIRSFDWSSTSVGAPDAWPESLRSILRMMLHARHPMFLWWGPELIQFYNDGYVPSFGVGRHPWALGQRGNECWAEIWPIIGPEIEGVIGTAVATYHEDALVPIFRNGRMEEVYWTYGYSPVFDQAGAVAGVLVVVTETTTRVVALRRLRTMRALADRVKLSADRDELSRDAVRVLGEVLEDVPWALAYRFHDATQIAASNVDAVTSAVVIARVHARMSGVASDEPVTIELDDVPLSGGPWPEPSRGATAIALLEREPSRGIVLVVGHSPRLPIDDAHASHMRGISHQLADTGARIDSQSGQFAAEVSRKDLLLQAPFAAALLVGPAWRFTLANELYEQMVGRRVMGREWNECFPELHDTPIEDILRGVFRDGVAFEASEQLVPLAGEERFFDFNMVPIRSGSGDVEAMMVVAVEVTTKVNARRELERNAAEREALVQDLRAASRAKDEFLAMMGHELRNPLAPLVTALTLIRSRGAVTAEHDVIERQVTHMTRLVDDLLDISRVTQGKLELRNATTEVSTLALHAIEIASPLFEKRQHEVQVEIAPDLWWHGDPTRLEQVLTNLLTNAARYTEPGGHIQLRVYAEGEHLIMRVRDDGIGIEPALLSQVFSSFVQSGRGTDRREGGLGLGLAIVQGLVAAHGGTVEAISEGPGKGSEFVVRVPGLVSKPRTLARAVEATTRRVKSSRVLLVDDNEDAATLTAELLRTAGHDVAIAHDGPTALTVAASTDPEIAILDIGLPVMDGYELLEKLREQTQRSPCRYVALTGYGRSEDVKRATAAGFERLLVKPVSIRALLEVVASAPDA
jgi:signal transduction histidine kinase/ActR/RegA family two-component response regulator